VCKNVSLAVLFGSKDNSFTICAQSDMCIYTVYIYIYIYIYIHTHTHTYIHTRSSQYRDAGWAKEIK